MAGDRYKGVAVSSGCAIGRAVIIKESAPDVSGARFSGAENERRRLDEAAQKYITSTKKLIASLKNDGRFDNAAILEGHLAMLADPFMLCRMKELIGKVPLFGICLGHQMISLACGAEMEKLKFGHRGGNQPVMNLVSGRVEITAQNHGFGLVFPSLGALVPEESGGVAEHPADGDLRFWSERRIAPVVMNERFGRIRLTHVNLNDGTCEGIQLLDQPCFCVQYHPEASPGPTDAHYLFTAFTRLMAGDPDYLNIDISKDRLAGWKFGGEVTHA